MGIVKKSLISPVTALCSIQDFVLAGNGSQLAVYSLATAERVLTADGLRDQRIHGIRKGRLTSDANTTQCPLIVFGQRSWRVFSFTVSGSSGQCCLQHVTDVLYGSDWILDAQWMGQDTSKLVLATSHNAVELWQRTEGDRSRYTCTQRSHCKVFCILYSCYLYGTDEESLAVFAGTVFNQVLVWYPFAQPAQPLAEVCHTLVGHEGVIFSIALDRDGTRVCTASDDRTVRVWQLSGRDSELQSECKLVMYGHTARVWKAIFAQDFVVSIGEDAITCVWDSEGRLVKEIAGHHGLSVWSVCVADTSFASIVTGGGDSGIRWWSLADVSHAGPEQRCLAVPDTRSKPGCTVADGKPVDFVRDVAVADQGHLLLLMNSGRLLLYSTDSLELQLLLREPAFASYSVMSLESREGLLALGGLQGDVNVVDWRTLTQSSCWKAHDGKVFSVTWACSTAPSAAASQGIAQDLFSVGPDGSMKWWKVCRPTSAGCGISHDLIAEFSLPYSKHRWLSAVLIVPSSELSQLTGSGEVQSSVGSSSLIVSGDRKGSLHVFQFATSGCPQPVCSLPGIHGKNGVTDITFHRGNVVSCGRDGRVREFAISSAGALQTLSDCKFQPGVDWLEKIVELSSGRRLVIGFHATSLVVWDLSRAEAVATVPCGGGHRSWHHCLSENKENVIFSFIQACRVHFCSVAVSEWSRQRILQDSFHGREVTCLTVVGVDSSGRALLATGSEDCSIRLSQYDPQCGKLQTLQHSACTHISGVRAIAAAPLSDNQSMLVSGGGRSQMKAWILTPPPRRPAVSDPSTVGASTSLTVTAVEPRDGVCDIQHVCQHPRSLSHREQRQRRQQPPAAVSAESRVMALSCLSVHRVAATLVVGADRSLPQGVLVCAAYSDGWLRIFFVDSRGCSFHLIAQSEQQARSLLCAQAVLLPGAATVAVITAGGSGAVGVWDIGPLLRAFIAEWPASDRCADDTTTASVPSTACQQAGLAAPYLVESYMLHQCTVTCLKAEERDGELLLISGGDDGSLAVHCLSPTAADAGKFSLSSKWMAYRPECHGSTITGICRLPGGEVVSTSCDQHVSLWKVDETPGAVVPSLHSAKSRSVFIPDRETDCAEFHLVALSTCISDVADCHSMVSWPCGESGSAALALGGAGLECVQTAQGLT